MKPKLGQVFLRDRNILKKIASYIEKNRVVFEIGAGSGELTEFLLDVKKLYINEVDKDLLDVLFKKFGNYSNLKIIEGDFLEVKVPDDVEVFTGNLPYYLQKKIIMKCLRYNFINSFFLIQKDVAERIINPPGGSHTGVFTLAVWRVADVKHIFNVKKHLFYPEPKVDGSFIKIEKRDEVFNEKFMEFIKKAFMHRRKKFIKSVPVELREKVLNFVPQGFRPQDLKLEHWKSICLLMKQ